MSKLRREIATLGIVLIGMWVVPFFLILVGSALTSGSSKILDVVGIVVLLTALLITVGASFVMAGTTWSMMNTLREDPQIKKYHYLFALVPAIVILLVFVTGCGDDDDTSTPSTPTTGIDARTEPYYSSTGYTEQVIVLKDGRHITCILHEYGRTAGISCDWADHTTTTEEPQ